MCMLMDMFKKQTPEFHLEDFLNNSHQAFNFFDIMTNYGKCWDFLTKDNNYSPVAEPFNDWVNFATKMYKILTYGCEDDEAEKVEEVI